MASALLEALQSGIMGKVMQALMPRVRGRADGKLVNQIVQAQLNGAGAGLP